MFAPVKGELFDLVLVNPPYFRGEPKNMPQAAYLGGRHLEWIRRFGKGLPSVLMPEGMALMVMGDAAETAAILDILRDEDITVRRVGLREYLAETISIFGLRPEGRVGDSET